MADHPADTDLVYGRHAVKAALIDDPGRARELLVAQGRRSDVEELVGLARAAGVRVRQRQRRDLDRLTGTTAHQGLVLIVDPIPFTAWEDILSRLGQGDRVPLVVVADGVQDAGNLGSIIRSAWCAGADALVIPKDRAVSLTGAVAKASAGAAFLLPVARVTNLTEASKKLQEAGLWVVGLDPAGDQVLYGVDLTVPTALVVGGEEKGLRPRVRGACDVVARLPMPEPPGRAAGLAGRSLNAAVAAAVALFEAVRQRHSEGDFPERP